MAMDMMPPAPGGPPPNIVFAGVSNGEVLWSLPPPPNADSPDSSNDGASVAGQPLTRGGGGGVPPGNYMDNFDWVRSFAAPFFSLVIFWGDFPGILLLTKTKHRPGRIQRHLPPRSPDRRAEHGRVRGSEHRHEMALGVLISMTDVSSPHPSAISPSISLLKQKPQHEDVSPGRADVHVYYLWRLIWYLTPLPPIPSLYGQKRMTPVKVHGLIYSFPLHAHIYLRRCDDGNEIGKKKIKEQIWG